MIDIRFGSCCDNCVDVDPDIQVECLFACDHTIVEKIVIIKCTHDKVCKAYLEWNHIKEEGPIAVPEEPIGTPLSSYGEYVRVFANNHGMSLDEASRTPICKARLDYFNKTGL